jgi:HKD family nuclease
MIVQRNVGNDNHGKVLAAFIGESERMVLCSGWLDYPGLELLLPSLDLALARGAAIRVYSNKKHTKAGAARALAKRSAITHVIADNTRRYLHTKLYYFENGDSYTAMIGSANLTKGGLGCNEELSLVLNGSHGDAGHAQITQYLAELAAAFPQS